jgi:hypothetical protein
MVWRLYVQQRVDALAAKVGTIVKVSRVAAVRGCSESPVESQSVALTHGWEDRRRIPQRGPEENLDRPFDSE